jgi:ferredoxin
MKIGSLTLAYFSPTGTTKKVIERIAQGINHSSVQTVDITSPGGREKQLQTSENELLVIGVPVYFGRVQTNAIEWVNTIMAYKTPTVCVVVYGNRAYDDALLELKDTALKSGGIPVACAAYIGEHSFSSSETPLASGRPDANDLRHAELFGRKIGEKLLSMSAAGCTTDITVPGNYPYMDMTESRNRLSCLDLVTVDEKCSQCGVCAEHCPVGAIDLEHGASVDTKKCILCHVCIRNCPARARSVKNDMMKNIALRLSQTCQDRKEPIFFL